MLSRPTLRFALLFSLLSLFLALNPLASALAADDEEDDEYEVTARVMRISLLRGEVRLRRAGNQEWETARLNLPLVEGDTLTTARDSRLEIQVDAYNFVRLGEDSVLHIVTLRDEGIALSLSEGTASLRLARFDRDREYFEMDAPQTTLAAERRGLYRLDVSREGRVRVTVRDDGRARIYSDTSGFTLREHRSAELVPSADDGGADWNLFEAASFDDWDRWNDERERYLATRLRYEERERYYDRDLWGAEELDAYGDWAYVSSYGWVWRPHVTVVNRYVNWAPYRYGRWSWCPPYGWTWVADEPWGWAPYHYGRWVYHENRWCWSPRGYAQQRRAWWRPALVAFVYVPTSYGEHVAWYPLTYGQRDPHARNWRRERLTPMRREEVRDLRRANPAGLRAVTSAPAREFGDGSLRARAATDDIAARALSGEPVRGRLPITPAELDRRNDAQPGDRRRGARLSPNAPARALPERPTGAAARTPGVALDETLRRTRIFNNREPRSIEGRNGRTHAGDGQTFDPNHTGAVMRPARPMRPTRPVEQREPTGTVPTDERRTDERRTDDERRIRERRLVAGDDSVSPATRERGETPEPRRERPALPPRTVRPTPRVEPDEQPVPRVEREERRAPERPTPRDEPRERPMPRQEEPRQERPRQEQPRQKQPRQEQPRQEPPRQERPRSEPRQDSESPRERPSPVRGPGKVGTTPSDPGDN